MSCSLRLVGLAMILAGAAVMMLGCAPVDGRPRGGAAAAAAAADAPTVPADVACVPATVTPLVVGTYDGRAVAVAYAHSDAGRRQGADLADRAKRAEAAGDAKALADLRATGRARQTVRHLQGFAAAPVDDLLAGVRDKLPAVAAKAGVSVIAPRTEYLDPAARTVDVTDALVALFAPDERTLRTIADLRKHPPMEMEAVLVGEAAERAPGK